MIHYEEENSAYRAAVDRCFKKLYLDEVCDILPSYDHPRIIEIWGECQSRIKKKRTIFVRSDIILKVR